MNYDTIRKQYNITHKFPFNSQRKRMSCILSEPTTLGKKPRLVIKGASEILLDSCTQFHGFQDEIMALSIDLRAKVLDAIDSMASKALRTLILAYKDLNENESLLIVF